MYSGCPASVSGYVYQQNPPMAWEGENLLKDFNKQFVNCEYQAARGKYIEVYA